MVDVKKIKELRAKGLSLREIADKLKIKRKSVEIALAIKEVKPAVTTTSEKKAAKNVMKPKGK